MKKRIPYLVTAALLGATVLLSCKKEYSCEGCYQVNEPPVALAGTDQVISFPTDSISLDGSASSDPDGKISDWLWKKVSGPVSFNIVSAKVSRTIVNKLVAGIYQFELIVTDDEGLNAKDTVQITVNDPTQPNRAPIADAGRDTIIILPANTANLDGSGSTDPDNDIISYNWVKISGPSSFSLLHPDAIRSTVSNLVEGSYLFELKVTDSHGLFDMDTVAVIINSSSTVGNDCDGSSRPQIAARLIPVANLSVLRIETAVASAGNKIVFAGGWENGKASSRVDIFDVNTNTWTTAELSEARANMATAVLGSKIFFGGGDKSLSGGIWIPTSNRVDIYDAATNLWTFATLSETRTFMAAAAAGDKVLFAGGSTVGLGANGESNRVDVYNSTNNSWSVDSLPGYGGPGISATAVNNRIYFAGAAENWFAWDFGGWSSAAINIYDVVSGKWTKASLREEKGAMGAIAVDDKIYWAGGYINNGVRSNPAVNTVEVTDTKTGLVTYDCLFQPNIGCAVVQSHSKIIFFTPHTIQNGYLPPDFITDKFDIFDLETGNWSIGVLPVHIYNASVISVNNKVFVAGGFVNGVPSKQVYRLGF